MGLAFTVICDELRNQLHPDLWTYIHPPALVQGPKSGTISILRAGKDEGKVWKAHHPQAIRL
jgi:hypothetical protein